METQLPGQLRLANFPTPIQRTEKLGREIDLKNLWVKRDDLTGIGTSGNKARRLEYTAAEAYMARGRNPLIVPLGASNAIGSLGYLPAIDEIVRQTETGNSPGIAGRFSADLHSSPHPISHNRSIYRSRLWIDNSGEAPIHRTGSRAGRYFCR